MEKKQIDWKFVIGTVILAAALILMGSFFWKTVAEQAEIVREEEARYEEEARSAIYMYYGNYFKKEIFVDLDTKEMFSCSIPDAGIYNRNGTLIKGDVLEEGDKVKIYGDNVLSDAVPPEYQNVTRMQRISRATLEEAEEYRRLVNESAEAWQ
ncbi:MAG: hypothetical protein IJ123_05855 [Blautia sp.]|nr:hypothetical protein [Blautia sp.]